MSIEKMNVYIITKDKVMKSEKEGKWFNNLFLPLFKSNKDPLKKQPQLNDYWNEIRNCLLGKKKNKSLKVIKHKDIKFIAFPVANNQILAFATGTEKSEALNDIYKLTREKSDDLTFEKYLKLIGAKETEAIKNSYNNLIEQQITDKDIKEMGYKNADEMIKKTANSSDFDFEHPYCSGRPLGTSIKLSNWEPKEWCKEVISCIEATSTNNNSEIIKEYKESIDEETINNIKDFGKWIIENYAKFWVEDSVRENDNYVTFQEFIDYYANKEVYNNLNKLYEVFGTYFSKTDNKSTSKSLKETNLSNSKLFELIKQQLKPYGEVKKVDKINFDDSARINIQIVTKKSEEEMWDIINKVVKPLFNNKFDVEVETVSNYNYMDTLLCPVLLKMKTKTLHKTLYSDIIIWLSDHEEAFKDYCKRFKIDFNNFDPDNININNTMPDDTMNWIKENKDLYSDFLMNYKYDKKDIDKLPAEKYIENDIKNEYKLYQAEINNINWDTYDDESGTAEDPVELKLPKGVSLYNIEADSIEDAKDQIAEILSDEYDWLVNGYDIDELKIQTENNHKDFENETFYKKINNKSNNIKKYNYDTICIQDIFSGAMIVDDDGRNPRIIDDIYEHPTDSDIYIIQWENGKKERFADDEYLNVVKKYGLENDGPVAALEEDKNQSLAEVEHDFITGLINYQDAIDTILDMGEADSVSDAQAIVDAWELKNKKDIRKAENHKFKIYLYNIKESKEDLKKLENHFEYLYGDTNPGDYWNIKVSDITDEKAVITGEMSGVSIDDFWSYINENIESDWRMQLDDIEWDDEIK